MARIVRIDSVTGERMPGYMDMGEGAVSAELASRMNEVLHSQFGSDFEYVA